MPNDYLATLNLRKALEHDPLTDELFARGEAALLAATSEVDARQIAAAMARFGGALLPLARTLVAHKKSAERKKGIELFAAAADPDTIAELAAAKAADKSKALHRDYDYAIRRIEKAAADRARPATDPTDRTLDPVARLTALEHMPADAFQTLVGVEHRFFARDYALATLDFDRAGRRPLTIDGATWHLVHTNGALIFEKPDGARVKTLPKPTSAAVRDQVKTLAKSIAELRSTRAARLTELLVTGEPTVAWLLWLLHIEHPLGDDGARQLIYEHRVDGAWRAFTVAEDRRTLVDVEGVAVQVPDDARVRLAHPADLDADALAAWQTYAADHEWLPLINQLGRPVHRAEDDTALTALVASFSPLFSMTFAGRLSRLGFRRGEVGDGGLVADHARVLADDITLRVEHSAMPVRRASLTKDDETTLRRALLTHRGRDLPPTAAPPRAYSEAVTLLTALGRASE